ncbi:class I SAM-dependent methyltransferase [Catenulispora subtropica]|uniref:Class I SAM-dependent methyltransferase n=1 Tax=Catenulispora subtropica TaxID=450798 RepID=A0ABN2RMJ7_9ACTN
MTAEFYDILQAAEDRRQAGRRFASAASAARVGIVDVGAGTGIVTEVLLGSSTAPVHAVEPAAAMRVALLTRLAGLRAEQRARVTVHPTTLQKSDLTNVADLVICSNIVGVLEPAERRAFWQATASALVPGGTLLLEPPPATVPGSPTVEDIAPVLVGADTYSAQVSTRQDRGLLSVTFTYRVEREDEVVRVAVEQFTMWPTPPETLVGELCEAGLSVREGADGLLRAVLGPAARA